MEGAQHAHRKETADIIPFDQRWPGGWTTKFERGTVIVMRVPRARLGDHRAAVCRGDAVERHHRDDDRHAAGTFGPVGSKAWALHVSARTRHPGRSKRDPAIGRAVCRNRDACTGRFVEDRPSRLTPRPPRSADARPPRGRHRARVKAQLNRDVPDAALGVEPAGDAVGMPAPARPLWPDLQFLAQGAGGQEQ